MSETGEGSGHEPHDAAKGPRGEAAPGAGHHPVDDEKAAAESQEAAAQAEQGEGGGSGGGGAPASAPPEAGTDDSVPAGPSELHGHPLTDSLGQAVVHSTPERYLDLCRALRDDGYDLMVGVTAVDYLVHPGRFLPDGVAPQRFEVVVELAAVATRRRLRIRCQVPAAAPAVPSLFDVWPGSEAHERETYDMYGIVFDGHPDPSRILMPEDWEGHPLRKDYASGRIPVQFKESPGGR